MTSALPTEVYQIKITLRDIRPPIWRRILVPSSTQLRELHDIVQIAMGWDDSHLHVFRIFDADYADADLDGPRKSEAVRLNKLSLEPKSKFTYEYDFGDSWEHVLLVEKILPKERGAKYPSCIAGKRACPPDDCGGAWGYENLLEILADPTHEDYEEMKEWAGDDFDPEAFSVADVNSQLQQSHVWTR